MSTDELDCITENPILVAVLTDPTRRTEVSLWSQADKEGARVQVLSGPAEAGPPTANAVRAGAVSMAPDGTLAFATGTAEAPALGLRAPGGGISMHTTPAPVLGVAWTGSGPMIRVDLRPGRRADSGAPGPEAVRVRSWTSRPVRDWDRWREECEPALLTWDGARWVERWRGRLGDRLVGHAAHPGRTGIALILRSRGPDGLDSDRLGILRDGVVETHPGPERTTLGDLHASAWGLTWTQHLRPESGFGGPVVARRSWGGRVSLLGEPGETWQVGHGFVGTQGAVLLSVARDGRRVLQRAGSGALEDLAEGITQACGHHTGWVGVQSGIGRPPHATSERDPVDTRPRSRPLTRVRSRTTDGTVTASWLVHAAGEAARPTLLWVHGGPLSQWADAWHPRWCPGVFVDRGYTVLMPNPRGSLGRGRAFRDAVGDNRWGEGAIDDLNAALDSASAHPAVDRTRLAVMGASFGGWASAWLAACSDRFRCAVVHAAPSHLAALHGDTDVPGFLEAHLGGVPASGTAADRWSPIHRVAGWRTPTLITHGQRDMRVPVGQAIALYQALHRAGGDVSLRIYPEAHHWLTHTADVLDWHSAVLAFLARHLGNDIQA